MATDAMLADQHVGLLAIEVDMPVAAGDRRRLRNHLRRRPCGQGIGQALGDTFGPGPVDRADHGDHRIARAVVLLVEPAQVVDLQLAQALSGALWQAAIGMVRIEVGPEGLTGQRGRTLQSQPQARQQLVAQPLEGLVREAGAGDDAGKQGQRRVQLVCSGEAAQPDQRHIPVRAVGEFGTQLFEGSRDGSGILVSSALVEHGVGHHRQAGLFPVPAGPRRKQHLHIQHRQLIGGHEIDPGTLFGHPVLQVQVASRRRLVQVDALQGFQFREQLLHGVRWFAAGYLAADSLGSGRRLAVFGGSRYRRLRRRLVEQPDEHGEYGKGKQRGGPAPCGMGSHQSASSVTAGRTSARVSRSRTR